MHEAAEALEVLGLVLRLSIGQEAVPRRLCIPRRTAAVHRVHRRSSDDGGRGLPNIC